MNRGSNDWLLEMAEGWRGREQRDGLVSLFIQVVRSAMYPVPCTHRFMCAHGRTTMQLTRRLTAVVGRTLPLGF